MICSPRARPDAPGPVHETGKPFRRRATTALGLLVVVACGQRDTPPLSAGAGNGPTLVPVDSVRLAEPDSILVGRLAQGFTVDDQGRFYVAASSAGRILRFGQDGLFERAYGRRGSGPGEFVNVFPVVYVTDSLVLGTSVMGRRVNVFHSESGRPIATRSLSGFLGSFYVVGDELWFGNFVRSERATVGSVGLHRLLADTVTATRSLFHPRMVPPPAEFTEFADIDMSPDVRVLRWGDTTVVGFAPLNHLVLVAGEDAMPETMILPWRARRGVQRDSLRANFQRGRSVFERAVESISFLEGLWRAPSGVVVAIHMDARASTTRDGRSAGVAATPYVSLLRPDLTAACVDARVPADPEARPLVWVRGDMLYVLEQVVTDTPTPTAELIVRSYRIVPDACTWLPLERGRGPALAD
jgi:hypothetical protein